MGFLMIRLVDPEYFTKFKVGKQNVMPFIPLRSTISDVSLGVWKIEEPEIFFLERVKLYENEWLRLSKIKHPQKRLEWLSSRLCLKELLKINNHIRVESLNNTNGKPYLTNNPHYISYTHSNFYSAAIASRSFEVGIDIEYLKHKRNLRTRFLFMNEKELAVFDATPEFELFLLIWSAKETIYKLYGQGVAFKENILIDFENFQFSKQGILPVVVEKEDHRREFTIHFTIEDEFLLTYGHDLLPQEQAVRQ
jgi:4'-phosphopantetheinyl transferase